MADEVTDASNREQVVVCFRWVDSDFEPHEDFVGLHKVDKINADTLVAVIQDVVLRMNLDLHNCRGQCYEEQQKRPDPELGQQHNCVRWRSVPYLPTVMVMP